MKTALTLLVNAKEAQKKSYADISGSTGLSRSFLKLVFDGNATPSRASAYRICAALYLPCPTVELLFDHWASSLRTELRTWGFLLDEYRALDGHRTATVAKPEPEPPCQEETE